MLIRLLAAKHIDGRVVPPGTELDLSAGIAAGLLADREAEPVLPPAPVGLTDVGAPALVPNRMVEATATRSPRSPRVPRA